MGVSKASTQAGKKPAAKEKDTERLVCENRKARFHYEVLDTFEAGLVLRGTEVKVLRQGKMTLEESYAKVQDDEVWLLGANVPEYSHGNLQNHLPKRPRKCLLHRREIRKLTERTQQRGLALVPLRVFFSARGLAKVVLAVCRGRKTHDKREHLRTKDARREMRERD